MGGAAAALIGISEFLFHSHSVLGERFLSLIAILIGSLSISGSLLLLQNYKTGWNYFDSFSKNSCDYLFVIISLVFIELIFLASPALLLFWVLVFGFRCMDHLTHRRSQYAYFNFIV